MPESFNSIVAKCRPHAVKAVTLIQKWAAYPAAWLGLLIIVGLFYFGSYVPHGINFRDEGGTVALVCARLLAGERPWVDVSLGGYNLLWYLPVVWLYKVMGVSFIGLRAYSFALSLVASVAAFAIVFRASRKPWLAFLTALMTVLVPGMTFKNYMPFLALVNTAILLHFVLLERVADKKWWSILAGGAAFLGLTFLIRIDLGTFFAVLWLGTTVLVCAREWKSAWRIPAAWGVIIATVCVLHLPVYVDAIRRGYDKAFVGQYLGWMNRLGGETKQFLGKPKSDPPTITSGAPTAPVTPVASHAPVATTLPADPSPEKAVRPKIAGNREVLQRPGWHSFQNAKSLDERWIVPLLYAPLFSLLPLISCGLWQMVRSFRDKETDSYQRGAAALVVMGGALTVFPQYFFFRPDAPHLSEFSPCFWAAVVAAVALLRLPKWPERIVVGLLVIHACLFLFRMLPDRWCGTAWIMKGRTKSFQGENGVRILVGKREKQGLDELLATIQKHSQPGEFVVAYPYHPAVNLLANRPTYERDVYVDNVTAGSGWSGKAIQRIKERRPALIVLSDWDVNGTDESRFSVWAAEAREWIAANYQPLGTVDTGKDVFELFARKIE